MKYCPKISLSIRNVKTLKTSTEPISSCYKLIGQWIHRTIWLCHNHKTRRLTHPKLPYNPQLVRCPSVFQSDNFCPTENNACPMDPWIHRTIWLCHNHQRRLHTRRLSWHIPNWIKPCLLPHDDVIFSPSDNSLSDGKPACPMDPSDPSDNLTFTGLPQSPGWPRAHIPNRIKACLSWRHFFSIGYLFVWRKTRLSDGSIGSIGQSDFCHNHQARRLHTSLIELNPACYDVIFSPSDNSLKTRLSDGSYGNHPLSDGSIGSIGQSDFHEVGAHAADMLEFTSFSTS